MRITASAPGKVVLLGEYAVLAGAPALVMAVDRRARVSLTANRGPECRLTAPGYSKRMLHFTVSGHPPRCDDYARADPEYRLAVQVINEILAAADRQPDNFDAELSTTAFYVASGTARGIKLGIGSSAALSVALGSALAVHVGWELEADLVSWTSRLVAIHRRCQGGQGSGLDVAAGIQGGVIEYRLTDGVTPRVRNIDGPPSIPMVFIWSGTSASTPDRVRRFQTWRRASRDAVPVLDDLGAIAQRGATSFRSRDTNGFVDAVARYADTLRALGDCAELEIFSPAHAKLAALAREFSAAYKPCGAGGGDIGIAVSRDPAALAALTVRVAGLGFEPIPLSIAASGLEIIRRPT